MGATAAGPARAIVCVVNEPSISRSESQPVRGNNSIRDVSCARSIRTNSSPEVRPARQIQVVSLTRHPFQLPSGQRRSGVRQGWAFKVECQNSAVQATFLPFGQRLLSRVHPGCRPKKGGRRHCRGQPLHLSDRSASTGGTAFSFCLILAIMYLEPHSSYATHGF